MRLFIGLMITLCVSFGFANEIEDCKRLSFEQNDCRLTGYFYRADNGHAIIRLTGVRMDGASVCQVFSFDPCGAINFGFYGLDKAIQLRINEELNESNIIQVDSIVNAEFKMIERHQRLELTQVATNMLMNMLEIKKRCESAVERMIHISGVQEKLLKDLLTVEPNVLFDYHKITQSQMIPGILNQELFSVTREEKVALNAVLSMFEAKNQISNYKIVRGLGECTFMVARMPEGLSCRLNQFIQINREFDEYCVSTKLDKAQALDACVKQFVKENKVWVLERTEGENDVLYRIVTTCQVNEILESL